MSYLSIEQLEARGPLVISPEIEAEIRRLNQLGISNTKIGLELGIRNRNWMHVAVKQLGLESSFSRRTQPAWVDDETIQCRDCSEHKNKHWFVGGVHLKSGRSTTYYMSSCKQCRSSKARIRLNHCAARLLARREAALKKATKARNLPYDLPKGYLHELWLRQRGLCFYTDVPLKITEGTGFDRHTSASVDRIDYAAGYTRDNIVLCSYRANSVKSDLTLDELSLWMPDWHRRIQNHNVQLESHSVI